MKKGETMEQINTSEMYYRVINCEEIDELKEILNTYSTYYSQWRDYINNIMLSNGLSYEKLGKKCGFSKNTIKSWIKNNKVPKSRDSFIKLGMGLRFNLQEINYMLQRYGKYSRLYSKSLEDAICIYVISHYPKDENVQPYDYCVQLKSKFLNILKTKNKRKYLADSPNETFQAEEKIQKLQNEDELVEFIRQNEVEYINSYYKLVDYIEAYIQVENLGGSYHSLVKAENLDKGFEKMFSNLKNWGEVPNRQRLIALGIKLNMSCIEINQLLEYANMEKLCPKDKIECIILYVLSNIDISNPEYQTNHMSLVTSYSNNPKIKEQCTHLLEELTGLKNSEEIEKDMQYYISDTLKSLDLEDEDYGILQLFVGKSNWRDV